MKEERQKSSLIDINERESQIPDEVATDKRDKEKLTKNKNRNFLKKNMDADEIEKALLFRIPKFDKVFCTKLD